MNRCSALLTPLKLNRLLQSAVFLVVAICAIPLIRQNARYLTTAVTEVLEGGQHGGDFIAFYAAGRLYAAHGDASPYDLERLRAAELEADPTLQAWPDWVGGGVNPFRNPPFYLPLLGYLARFPLPTAFVLSALAGSLLLGGLLAVTAGFAARQASPPAAVAWLSLSLAYYDVWHGLFYGQVPAYLIALAFAAGLLLLRAGRPLWAGLTFALLWLKVQYVAPLALFLLILRQRQALLGLVTGSLILLALSLAVVGVSGLRLYLETLVRLAAAPRGMYAANYESMINWRGLLERAFADTYPEVVIPAQVILIALTYSLAVWAWMAPMKGSAWRWDLRLLVLALTMVLASPHVHVQDMVLLLPPMALMMGYLWRETSPWPIVAVSAAALLFLFWLLPLQTFISPKLHLSALLVALLFFGCTLVLRAGPVSGFTRGHLRP